MSEPAKKFDQTPESYSPKEMPEIMKLAGEAQGKADNSACVTTSSSGGGRVIPVSHPLNRDMSGENYWFNGCARFTMECLGETDYDYWFFAGLTGDIFTQFYPRGANNPNKCAVSAYFMGPDYAEWVFGQVGYACEYVTEEEVLADRARYLKEIADSIDRGVPVINSACEGVIVGYEDGALLYYAHEWAEPKRLTLGLDRFIEERELWEGERKFSVDRFDLIFVGEKQREVSLALLYRDAIARLPGLLMGATEDYVFGARAFRAWANDIERGKFDDPALFDDSLWEHYTNYVCVLATNGSCCFSFLEKAMELNPDMAWLKAVYRQHRIMGMLWIGGEGNDKEQLRFLKEYKKQHGRIITLEKLGGGFNVSYKTLQNPKKRAKIVARIREFADCADEVVRILEKGLEGYTPKEMPEIMKLAGEAQGGYRHIAEIQPMQETLEVFQLPACRVIGIEQTYKLGSKEKHAAAPQWQRVTDADVWKTICALPRVIPNACFGWACECVPKKKKAFSYFVSMLTPADTPVPEGCQYRDVPATLVAAGRWDESMHEVIENMKPLGYETYYGDSGCGWNAELYLDAEEGIPTPNGQEWRWLIPCKETPESYTPKEMPEIMKLAGEIKMDKPYEIKPAPATIKTRRRNAVRIIELPACKMVTSGPASGEDIWGPGGVMERFDAWWVEQDKQRKDHFYPRDFLWSPPEGGFQWGYSVTDVPDDTGGFDVIDFPGGLYAVAISVDADGKDHDKVYNGIQKWVKSSGCFALDETDTRRSLGNITSPVGAKEIMGYNQMDLYFPIRTKEAGEK